jgi:hypothetical protein
MVPSGVHSLMRTTRSPSTCWCIVVSNFLIALRLPRSSSGVTLGATAMRVARRVSSWACSISSSTATWCRASSPVLPSSSSTRTPTSANWLSARPVDSVPALTIGVIRARRPRRRGSSRGCRPPFLPPCRTGRSGTTHGAIQGSAPTSEAGRANLRSPSLRSLGPRAPGRRPSLNRPRRVRQRKRRDGAVLRRFITDCPASPAR